MYSNLIERPTINHILPCGVLSELSCRWGGEDLTILSIYRPVLNPEPGSLRSIVESLTNSPLESCLWNLISDFASRSSIILCGDFNLSPSQLDKRLTYLDLFIKRVPFTGDHYSFRRWDSTRQVLQRSSIDHLVWNGQDP
jgi:hypothetical protein